MNNTSVKLKFCAEWLVIFYKIRIYNTKKFEKKPGENRYILVENLICSRNFAWKYNLLDTY